jgi:hypothetical protein
MGTPKARSNHTFPDTLGKVIIDPHPLKEATILFIRHGARAAADYLGGGLRATILLPRVLARAQYLEREAKRLSFTQGV